MKREFFRRLQRTGEHDRSPTEKPLSPDPEQAWKVLSLVNDWIRHADAKAGVTLAFCGVLGAMLFNLARDASMRSCLLDVLIVGGCLFLVLTALLCGLTLTPRLKDADTDPKAINRVFFESVSRYFAGDRRGYIEALTEITSNPSQLIKDLGDQIHANAKIATLKVRYAKWAIRSALVAGVCVAAVALTIGIGST